MNYLFLIAAFNAFFFAFLTTQKKKALHDKILIAWLVYLGLYTGIYALFSAELFTNQHLLSASFISMLLLHGPFLYLYLSALIKPKSRITLAKLVHFIPFLLFNFYLFAASFFPATAEGIRLDHQDTEHTAPLLFAIFLLLTVVSGPFYFLLTIRLFKKLDIHIFNNFSSYEHVNPDWLRKLVYTFGCVWTLLMAVTTIHHVFHFFTWTFCTDGLTLSLSIFILLIGYFGLKQQEIFVSASEPTNEFITEHKTRNTGILLKETEVESIVQKLKQCMDTEKPYLDADLSLPQLAHQLDIPSHHLSRVINAQFGANFFDFVNQYRIEEVKARMVNPDYKHLSLLGIAFDSGFNTKSAFNRVFKKMTGVTPSEYRKEA